MKTLPPPPDPRPDIEQLGPKTFLGMEATGRRFKVVTPAQPGTNEPADAAVEESWQWSDHPVEVLRLVKHANGEYQRSEIKSFEDGAPDSTLFEIPEGYSVRDVFEDAPRPLPNP